MQGALHMNRLPVNSSHIHTVGYDPHSKTMEVEFKNGGLYQYHGVTSELFHGVAHSKSPGDGLNEVKKLRIPFTKIKEQ